MKKLIIPLIIIVLLAIGVYYYIFIYKVDNKTDNNNTDNKTTEVTAGNYKLINNPTKYQKTVFNELKEILETENYLGEDLASSIVKNFIAEFYTLSTVNSKEVRGTQFVPDVLKDRFVAFGSDVYNYYAYYTNKDDLEVKSIDITDVDVITYDYDDDLNEIDSVNDLEGFEITTDWKYKDNTENKTVVTIVKWDENYSVIKVDNEE